MDLSKHSLREKCPNTALFLALIFLYSNWIQENTDQKKLHFSRSDCCEFIDSYLTGRGASPLKNVCQFGKYLSRTWKRFVNLKTADRWFKHIAKLKKRYLKNTCRRDWVSLDTVPCKRKWKIICKLQTELNATTEIIFRK